MEKYSTINGDTRKQIYIVKNGKLSILSSSLNMKIGQAIIENANGKEYETILKDDGTLQDLKKNHLYIQRILKIVKSNKYIKILIQINQK